DSALRRCRRARERRRQSQRLDARDRGGGQRALQRLRPDAASGACGGTDARRGGRTEDISVDSWERAMSEQPVSIPGEPKVDLEQARAHGLAPVEYRKIEQIIGRTPTYTELGVFSVMWSEHCSYKS